MAEDKPFDKDNAGLKNKAGVAKDGAKSKPEDEPMDGAVDQTISLFLAVGLIVSALVVGLVVGYVVAPKGASNDLGAPAGTAAPALTPEQLDSNQLPPSHPPLPGAGAEATESAPAEGGGASSATPSP